MKIKKVLCILILLSVLPTQSQELSTRDSISVFYDSLIYQLKTNYLYTETTNWEAALSIKENAMQEESFGASLSHCIALFDTINGSHLNIFSDYGWYKWSKGRQYKQEEFHPDFLRRYESQPGFEVKVLEGGYGYILMPGMLMIDLPQDSIDLQAQRMYDQIIQVSDSAALKGWIIDLRFNIGGNIFPMLAALYHLLGDNSAFVSLDKAGAVKELAKLEEGTVYDDRKVMASITPLTKPDIQIPVALITGIITASSGELVAVSFKGRDNVKIIGEPTAGMLTGNTLTLLPFDIKIALTTGYLADRTAKYKSKIDPDIPIMKQAHFEDLLLDANVAAAVHWFTHTEQTQRN